MLGSTHDRRLRVLELPGHGTRASEGYWSLGHCKRADDELSDRDLFTKLLTERDAFISARCDELMPLIMAGASDNAGGESSQSDKAGARAAPYALYGFSSGALFSYLIVLELARRRAPLPFRLLVCGRSAPHMMWKASHLRVMRCGIAEDFQEWLHQALAVPKDERVPTEDEGEDAVAAFEAAREAKHALWRAPLLTSAICAGNIDAAVGTPWADLQLQSRSDRVDIDFTEVQHASSPPAVPTPLVVLASSADKVWPMPLTDKWQEVAPSKGASNGYKTLHMGKLSHFKLMCSDAVIHAASLELASAALAATTQSKVLNV